MFVYIGKNPRFTAFLDSNLHTRLAIVTENELGLAFPPRNLPQKFRPDPSTFYLVIVVTNRQTDRQTDRQTNAGKNIMPRFRGDNEGRCSNSFLSVRNESLVQINACIVSRVPYELFLWACDNVQCLQLRRRTSTLQWSTIRLCI